MLVINELMLTEELTVEFAAIRPPDVDGFVVAENDFINYYLHHSLDFTMLILEKNLFFTNAESIKLWPNLCWRYDVAHPVSKG
uniref:Uncharacterized protein n=1 Tax=Romanomermis culicivorax TaxID=13658 RepID=A0A915K2F9_ROMCU